MNKTRCLCVLVCGFCFFVLVFGLFCHLWWWWVFCVCHLMFYFREGIGLGRGGGGGEGAFPSDWEFVCLS